MVGGGGFRVPQMFQALAADPGGLITDLTLVDIDQRRLDVVMSVIRGLAANGPDGVAAGASIAVGQEADSTPPGTTASGQPALETGHGTPPGTTASGRPTIEPARGPRVTATTDLAAALPGADFVFTAIREGGTAGRAADEEIALAHGLLGQETVGPGGMAYAIRTIPVARTIAAMIAQYAPEAWVINFTNPAGIITQAMRESLEGRVIGICDTPIGLVNRIADVTGATVTSFDYAGLNHLGWLRGVRGVLPHEGGGARLTHGLGAAGARAGAAEVDLLARVLDDDALLSQIEEARLFGHDIIRSIGALPNEYLFYYWHQREAIARLAGRQTRGRQLVGQQGSFYEEAAADPGRASELWQSALAEREETYGSETRDDPQARRDSHEIALGGYQKVALQLMRVLAGAEPPTRMILNIRNDHCGTRAIEQLPHSAVVEIACEVSADGVRPAPAGPLSDDLMGLAVQIKGCDELLLAATAHHDPVLALRAFATHPLVDSLEAARALLAEYCEQQPAIAAALGAQP